MAILQVHQFPDPILKKICAPVTDFDSKLNSFVNDFTETLQSHNFCVGLAAPQVGNLQRIIAIDVSRARKPQLGNGLLILINPVILESSNFKFVREGCLSIPDFTANVKRAMKITVQYQEYCRDAPRRVSDKVLETTNFEAHAIQHEMDHLDGILFLDRITNPASDLFRRKRA
ncbi:MAG: peptide deformylase [Candidatus Melainabacteria bacterium RIFCSPHIGHO2_02_FULL_34_12]|nr:MAG: peptide deformylase [Candidatus Melainabacteria bacterium RIFCSPHIGHO2_02_FULL_34_12]